MRRSKKEEEQVKETGFTNLDENSLFEMLKLADTKTLLQAALRQQAMAQDTKNEHLWELICTHHFANVECATQQLRSVVLALGGSRRLRSRRLRSLYLDGSRRFLSLPFFLSQSKPKLKSLTPPPQNLSFASKQNKINPYSFSLIIQKKIPRDLTEASLSGTGLSIIAALSMLFVFGMIKYNKTIRKFSIGPDVRPTGSEFHSMPEADDDSVEGSHTLTADNFDSYSHEYPILAVNFYAPWCYWSKCLTSSHDVVNNFSSFSLSLYLPHHFFFFQKPSWEKAAKEVMLGNRV
ncbi:hypothetical protein CUMW_273500 [Citrus unshiu]|uniref:Thioredoxin domain-containing protein n=1 Tax=Citrus unshiu TaxID=55188 RepID=A0A2H5MXG8_CITUN|nr:hypothetical protein CUMW_273500 [Citrus unshiu]